MNTQTIAPVAQTTKETVEQIIANLKKAQGRLNLNDTYIPTQAFNQGYYDGIKNAIAHIEMMFAAELSTVIIEEVPAEVSVKDWSNIPAHQRPEPKMNFGKLEGSAHAGFNYKYETSKAA